MQQEESWIEPLIATETNRDLVAPAAKNKAPHQHWLIGEDERFLTTCVLHCYLLSLHHAHI